MGHLDDKIALVTGGASGIGAATCRRLAAEGATVVVADVADEPGRSVATEVGGTFIDLDVTTSSAWAAGMAEVVGAHGRVDLVHLNAGLHPGIGDICEVDDDTYERQRAVNVDGVFWGLRAALTQMRRQDPEGGAVVITASLAGLIAYPIDPVYNMTKHAVVGLMRGADIAAGTHITVNTVNPGIVDTPMLGQEGLDLLVEAGFPVIHPDEVADAVVQAATSGRGGEAWIVQAGLITPFRFPNIPGPAREGGEHRVPPIEGLGQ